MGDDAAWVGGAGEFGLEPAELFGIDFGGLSGVEDVEEEEGPAEGVVAEVSVLHAEGGDRFGFAVGGFLVFGVPDIVVSDDADVGDFDFFGDDFLPVGELSIGVLFGVALVNGEDVVATEDEEVGAEGVGFVEGAADAFLVVEYVVGETFVGGEAGKVGVGEKADGGGFGGWEKVGEGGSGGGEESGGEEVASGEGRHGLEFSAGDFEETVLFAVIVCLRWRERNRRSPRHSNVFGPDLSASVEMTRVGGLWFCSGVCGERERVRLGASSISIFRT